MGGPDRGDVGRDALWQLEAASPRASRGHDEADREPRVAHLRDAAERARSQRRGLLAMDEEEVLRDKLLDARNTRPSIRREPESPPPPPPPIKFGSFGKSDTLITASPVEEIASSLEPPASLLRRLSSAGAA